MHGTAATTAHIASSRCPHGSALWARHCIGDTWRASGTVALCFWFRRHSGLPSLGATSLAMYKRDDSLDAEYQLGALKVACAKKSWVQQAGVAHYSAEMAAQYTELEISRFTSMLQARLSILSDLEMVLYLALLLGPRVMAACLHEVLQQRAGAALQRGQRFPPDLAHALSARRPCVPSPSCSARPTLLRQPLPATIVTPSRAPHGVPSCMPALPVLSAPGSPGPFTTPPAAYQRPSAGGRRTPASLVQDRREAPSWPLTASAVPHTREQWRTEVPSPAQSSSADDASSEGSTPRRPTRRRLDY